jgi:acetylornithine deacetylase/succinyl-diaminopimelate desuccinylase-like protein
VGSIQAGEIYNQAPVSCRVAGTRRWLPGADPAAIREEFQASMQEVARDHGVRVDGRFNFVRDAFELDADHPIVHAFQTAHEMATGRRLPTGAKPFVDDGNTFVSRGRVPAITHGPAARGAHTLHEEVAIDELVRVALVYALAAVAYCHAP